MKRKQSKFNEHKVHCAWDANEECLCLRTFKVTQRHGEFVLLTPQQLQNKIETAEAKGIFDRTNGVRVRSQKSAVAGA